MKFTISARQTNSANTADGYTEWQEVDEWNAENAETAIDQWMDNMRYVDDRFVQTGASSYRLDDMEFDAKAEIANDGEKGYKE